MTIQSILERPIFPIRQDGSQVGEVSKWAAMDDRRSGSKCGALVMILLVRTLTLNV